MNFSWPEEYLEYYKEVAHFAASLGTKTLPDDESQNFPYEDWQKCVKFGILGLPVTKMEGGSTDKVDFLRAMFAMEAFGYGCKSNALAFGLNAQMWTVQTPIFHFGSEYQKKEFLIPMVIGEFIGAHALTEPDAGSDIYSMSMSAEKVEGGYVLNGKKHLITFAPICNVALVFAKTNASLGKWGVSAFLVKYGTEGFSRSEKKTKMGLRSIPFGELEFKDCFIPERDRLGTEGMGFSILNNSLEYDRCCILASQLGAMQRQLEESIKFVKKRKQFGKNIGQFQSVSNRIADMKLRLETSRLLLYKTAWLKANDKNAILEASLLKLHLSESFLHSSLDAIRNLGGIGYLHENGAEMNLRDAMGGVLYAGTSDIQRNIITKLLGL